MQTNLDEFQHKLEKEENSTKNKKFHEKLEKLKTFYQFRKIL